MGGAQWWAIKIPKDTGGWDGHSEDGLGMGYCLILSIKMVRLGILCIVFSTVNWLYVEGLNIEVGANKWGGEGAQPTAHSLTLVTDHIIIWSSSDALVQFKYLFKLLIVFYSPDWTSDRNVKNLTNINKKY